MFQEVYENLKEPVELYNANDCDDQSNGSFHNRNLSKWMKKITDYYVSREDNSRARGRKPSVSYYDLPNLDDLTNTTSFSSTDKTLSQSMCEMSSRGHSRVKRRGKNVSYSFDNSNNHSCTRSCSSSSLSSVSSISSNSSSGSSMSLSYKTYRNTMANKHQAFSKKVMFSSHHDHLDESRPKKHAPSLPSLVVAAKSKSMDRKSQLIHPSLSTNSIQEAANEIYPKFYPQPFAKSCENLFNRKLGPANVKHSARALFETFANKNLAPSQNDPQSKNRRSVFEIDYSQKMYQSQTELKIPIYGGDRDVAFMSKSALMGSSVKKPASKIAESLTNLTKLIAGQDILQSIITKPNSSTLGKPSKVSQFFSIGKKSKANTAKSRQPLKNVLYETRKQFLNETKGCKNVREVKTLERLPADTVKRDLNTSKDEDSTYDHRGEDPAKIRNPIYFSSSNSNNTDTEMD